MAALACSRVHARAEVSCMRSRAIDTFHGRLADGPYTVAWTAHGRWHGRFMEGYHVLGAAGVARVELREPLARREDLARVDLDVGGLGQGGWAGKGVGATERGQGGCG